MEKPKQIDEVEILNPEDRIFKAWGSVEVRDKEGDYLPISEFKKIMPIIMKRGGILMDRHSNRQVGRILNYEFKTKMTPNGEREGVYLTNQIFKDYEMDDMVWDGVKKGVYQGLSFGGRNKNKDVKFEKGGDITKILTGLEGYEFSLVPGMGNQEATMDEINYLAKSENLSNEDIQKPFAGYENFDACVKSNSDKSDPEAYCAVIMRKVESVNKIFNYTDDKNKEIVKNINKNTLLDSSNTNEKYLKKSDLNNNMESKEFKKEGEDIAPQNNPMEEIKQMLSQILEAVSVNKQNEDKPEDKEPEQVEKTGEKVTLPKVIEEDIQGKKPAEGSEKDKVNFVQKEDVKQMLNEKFEEIKKMLVKPEASTPRVNQDSLINKQEKLEFPRTFAEANKFMRGKK